MLTNAFVNMSILVLVHTISSTPKLPNQLCLGPKHWFTVEIVKIKNGFPSSKIVDFCCHPRSTHGLNGDRYYILNFLKSFTIQNIGARQGLVSMRDDRNFDLSIY